MKNVKARRITYEGIKNCILLSTGDKIRDMVITHRSKRTGKYWVESISDPRIGGWTSLKELPEC